MRINLPVTQREYAFHDGETLVSTTDLKGKITYCNPSFIRVSGYQREELIGQPHNLIRHPDMPSEAYRDMWSTIQSGRPWSAMVKNRRKDGDHYWVRANVTPIVGEDGKPVGYMSVRTKPTTAQVQAAEGLYARMREEAKSGSLTLKLDGGLLESAGVLGRARRLLRIDLRGRLMLAIGLALVAQWVWLQLGLTGVPNAAGLIGLGAAMAIGAGLWIGASVSGPLRGAIEIAQKLAAGDLRGRIESNRRDDLGRLYRTLNQLSVNLQAIVGDVRREVEGVSIAAKEIAQGNQDLSSRTEAQAASLEQTAASMEELTSAVEQNSAAARQANNMAAEASETATQGGSTVGQVVGTMTDIEQAARRIADIISVIDGIAFQTNILALNAAVEAARAGEQGRGFAVVASEVRALAQRTTQAAREIKALIGDSVGKVEHGTQVVNQAGNVIGAVVESVKRVNDLITEITTATVQQASGLSQVNEAVTQLDQVTQQNAALVEQSSAAAASLREQAHALMQAVQIFRVDGLAAR
jgi:aerotaxis receptor